MTRVPGPTAAAPPKAALVVCSDRNWLWQSAFALQQAIDSDPDGRMECFYVTDFAPEREPLAYLLDRRVTVINVADRLDHIAYRTALHVPKATFLRFLALDILAGTHAQVIYIDADILLSWGSWADLFGLAGQRRAVAAVGARSVWMNRPTWRYGRKYRHALSPRIGDRYLNAGVLVINSDGYRQAQVTARALAFFAENPALCVQGDQSALNAVLEGDWDELSPSWNWQVAPFNLPVLAIAHPRAIHFTGPIKPWTDKHGFFRPALDRMADFLRQRGAAAPLASIEALRAAPVPSSDRALRFRADWAGDPGAKLRHFDRYLHRRDFIDTMAGLPGFSPDPSGFGAPTAPGALAPRMTQGAA